MGIVAGVDSSTQSTKVELRDADSGRLLASGRSPHPTTTPPRSEQPPEAWWEALRHAWGQAWSAARPEPGLASDHAAAVSVAAQQHGLVLTDAGLTPLRPAKLWNDTEAAACADELVSTLGAPSWAGRTGSVPTAAFTIAKLAWVARHEPNALTRAERVLLPHDWLTARLCGATVTDRGDASGTGYWSPSSGSYLHDVLEVAVGDAGPDAGWSAVLPEILGPHDAAGLVSSAASDALPQGARATVGPGTGDNMAAALALGLRPGDVAISLGTSGTVFAVSTVATADASGAVAGFADANAAFLPLVCTLNCTKVTAALAALLGLDEAAFHRLALEAPPGADGVVLVPYLDGERTPNRPDATGTLTGLRSDTNRASVARAAVEGVVCGLLDGIDALRATGVPTDGRVLLVGGGARSPAFRQVCADLMGREVLVPPTGTEWVAAGAAVQAAAVLTGASPAEVAAGWNLTAGATAVTPAAGAGGDQVRQAYAAARGAR